jgi:hypothetical protein
MAILLTALSAGSLGRAEEAPAHTSSSVEVESATQNQARLFFKSGTSHYAHGEFALAVADFHAALALAPRPALLYDLAQAERLAGQCQSALLHYREFVQTNTGPPPVDIDEKLAEMSRCIEKERGAPAAMPPREPIVVDAVLSPRPPEVRSLGARSAGNHATVKILAFGAIGGAAVSVGLGAMFLARAHSATAHVEDVNRPGQQWSEQYESYQASARLSNDAALGLFVISGLMVGAATWLFLSHPQRSPAAQAKVSAIAAHSAVAVGTLLQF